MLLLDHVVIHVADLDAAIADYASLGFNVQRGGTHADGATHNALIVFADGSYIELIAFLDSGAPHRWAEWARRGREGFIDFALLPRDVGEAIAAAKSRGLEYDGQFDGGRKRPDGETLHWQIGTPQTPDLPFLCGDVTPRALRVREGDVRLHPNGARGIGAVTVAVADLAASLSRWRALLGPQANAGPRLPAVPGLGLQIATLTLGATIIMLAGTVGATGDAAALHSRLADHGEGLVGIALHAPPRAQARLLPVSTCHGASIEIVAQES